MPKNEYLCDCHPIDRELVEKTKNAMPVREKVDRLADFFAIIGDEGINKEVEHDFWNDIKDEMISNFKENKFAEGLIAGILECGDKLKKYFPHQNDDVNELSDEISFN